MKQLSDAISRNLLFETNAVTERQKLEAASGLTLRQMDLFDILKKHEAGTISASITEQKIIDLAIEGAEFTDLVNRVATFTSMEEEVAVLKVRGYTSKAVYKGIGGVKPRDGGGFIDSITFNCKHGTGLKRTAIQFDNWKLTKKNAGELAIAIKDAGKVLMDNLLEEVLDDLIADVNSSFTNTVANWGNNHYKSLLYALGLIAAEKMYPTVTVINPTEIYDLGILDYFIHADYNGKAGNMQAINQNGLFGYLLPNQIPIYFHASQTTAYMTMLTQGKSAFVGVYQPLTIRNFEDILQGVSGAVLEMQYDVKNGSNAEKTKPTAKSWAVVSGA